MDKITVELRKPIMYANGGGNEVEGGFLEISEPTGKVAHLVGALKVQVGSATKASIAGMDLDTAAAAESKAPTAEPNPEETGDALFAIMTMGGADMKLVMVTFKEILRETATVAAEKTFTAPMWDRMAYPDIEKALKSYLGNFIAALD